MSDQLALFDYAQLDAPTRDFVEQRTDEIRALGKRMAMDIVGIGQRLVEIKGRLGHGHFGNWLDFEFGWTDRTARNFMNVARSFKSETVSDLNIQARALYLLSSSSTPQEARDEAIERAEEGEEITHAKAKEIVDEYKDEPEDEPESEAQPFICPDCGELFQSEVWHCAYCHSHWSPSQGRCLGCDHEPATRGEKADLLRIQQEAPELLEQVRDGTLTIPNAKKQLAARNRQEQRDEMAQAAQDIEPSDRWQVFHADMQTWAAPQRYDFIITDPPYPREYLPLYEVLAQRAADWLQPGGLLVAMCGQSYLDDIMAMMVRHLDYYWTAAYLTPGQPTPLRQRQVNTTWKPLLMFTLKGDKYKGKIFGDVFTSTGSDKDHHDWGQSLTGMPAIIKQVCLPGQWILDPFVGAGATGVAALMHGCLFHGVDIDETNTNLSRKRLFDYDSTAK